jgi:hypothetical protein
MRLISWKRSRGSETVLAIFRKIASNLQSSGKTLEKKLELSFSSKHIVDLEIKISTPN